MDWSAWYGDPPAAWPCQRISHIGSVTLGKMVESAWNEGVATLPYLRAANVQPDGVLATDDVKHMPFSDVERRRLTLSRGDVVVVEGGVGGYGRSAFIEQDLPGWGFQNSIIRIRPHEGVDGRFVTYCLLHLRQAGYIAIAASTASMPHFTVEKVAATRIPTPSSDVQRQIAEFLDYETGEIDAFIADQERLIDLLTERRLALITRGITGQERAGTRLVPLKRFLSRIEQGKSPDAAAGRVSGTQIGVLKTGCANGGVFDANQHKVLPDDFAVPENLLVRTGDIVTSRASGSPRLVGSTARVLDAPFPLILSDKIFRLTPSSITDPDFLVWAMNSRLYREQVEATLSGAEGLANNISLRALTAVRLPMPPREDQTRIARQIDAAVAKIAAVIGDAREAIALSRERRVALISAAVTGQIDVRGWERPVSRAV